MHTPQSSHPLQIVLWNQCLVAAEATEIKAAPEQEHLSSVEEHHHLISLVFGVQDKLDKRFGAKKKKLEVTYSADGYDRASLTVTDVAYVKVIDDKALVYKVEVPYYVYPENITTVAAPKKDDRTPAPKTAAEIEDAEYAEKRAQKLVIKTEANLPIVFTHDGKAVTRHYQEVLPMHSFKGMTNRLLANLIGDVTEFLTTGTLPRESL